MSADSPGVSAGGVAGGATRDHTGKAKRSAHTMRCEARSYGPPLRGDAETRAARGSAWGGDFPPARVGS
jgi:hypothetical protein